MTKPGLYLVNSTEWGVHEAGSLLIRLSSIKSCLNDCLIHKAKTTAKDLRLGAFSIVHVNNGQKQKLMYIF